MKLLFVICDRNITEKVLDVLNETHVHYHISCYAKGTANSEILSYFGLAETDKELILSFVEDEYVKVVMEKLGSFEFIKNHGAVAFTVPLDGIGRKTQEFIHQLEEKYEWFQAWINSYNQ